MDKKVVFSTRIDEELRERVRDYSRKTGIRITHLTAEALEKYLRDAERGYHS